MISHAVQQAADLAEVGREVLKDVVQHPAVREGNSGSRADNSPVQGRVVPGLEQLVGRTPGARQEIQIAIEVSSLEASGVGSD